MVIELTQEMIEYFFKLESEGIILSESQKKWYFAKKNILQDDMMREYPSTPHEAFAASQEGYWFGPQMRELYDQQRVCTVPYDKTIPVHTSWDLGVADYCAIWFFQLNRQEDIRIIDHFHRTDTTLDLICEMLNQKGYNYGTHLWPFDANARDRAGITFVQQARDYNLSGIVLERSSFLDGINLVRSTMSKMWFDQLKCKEGLKALAAYKKKWNTQIGGFTSEPVHDWASHSSDSLRYLCIGYKKLQQSGDMDAEVKALRNYFAF